MADVQHQQHHHISGWTAWIAFAGFMMGFAGFVHVLYGIGGILKHDWYITGTGNAVLMNTSDWGWGLLVGGILLIIASSLLLAGNMVGRIAGGLLAAGSLLANAALLSVAPVWALIAIIIDIAIIYAVIAHGGELKHLDE